MASCDNYIFPMYINIAAWLIRELDYILVQVVQIYNINLRYKDRLYQLRSFYLYSIHAPKN